MLNLPSLYYRRRRVDMITVYQVLHRRVDVEVSVLPCNDYIPHP